MPLISDLTIRYAAQGFHQVLDAERRVRSSISETARRAAKDEGTTKRWMERHKTALLGIGVAASGVMAAIVAGSPSLQAALGETRLWFSMFAEEMGSEWSPALEWFNGLLGDAYNAFEKLPDPLKSVFAWGLFVALGILGISGAVAGLTFLLGPLNAALGSAGLTGILSGGLGLTTAAGGLTTLGAVVGILSGLVGGSLFVWLLWKLGVIQAIEDAGAGFMRFAQNTLTILGNLKDNVIEWFTLVTQSAALWGANFALSWIEGIASNVPFLGDLLAPQINSLHAALDSAGADLQVRWDKWNAGGGFVEGLTEGTFTGANTPNRAISDLIAGIDSMVFGTGSSSQLTAADREARLNDLYGGAAPFAFPTPQPAGGAVAPAAGETNYITPVNVTLNVTGSQAQGIDERRLAELIARQIADALRGRSR